LRKSWFDWRCFCLSYEFAVGNSVSESALPRWGSKLAGQVEALEASLNAMRAQAGRQQRLQEIQQRTVVGEFNEAAHALLYLQSALADSSPGKAIKAYISPVFQSEQKVSHHKKVGKDMGQAVCSATAIATALRSRCMPVVWNHQ
jgi:preprotein translocase subunit SecF